jgi:aminoglycoside phosphotransferase (APT) family kinase protein
MKISTTNIFYLLSFLIDYKQNYIKKRNKPLEILFRIHLFIRFILLSIKSNLSGQKHKYTILCGGSVKFGNGSLTLCSLGFWKFFKRYIFHKDMAIIFFIKELNEYLINSIQHDLGSDTSETFRFQITPHGILIVEFVRNGVSFLAKFSVDKKGKRYLLRHINALKKIKQDIEFSQLDWSVPSYVTHRETSEGVFLIQTYVEGRVCRLPFTDDAHLLRLLKICADQAFYMTNAINSTSVGWLAYHQFHHLNQYYSEYNDELANIYLSVDRWLDSHHSLQSVIHGDFWLGNIIFDDTYLSVSGVIDWDRCSYGGCILHDALHLFVSTVSKQRGQHFGTIIIAILKNDSSDALLTEYIQYILDKYSISIKELKFMAVILWFYYLQISGSSLFQVGNGMKELISFPGGFTLHES